MRNSGKPSLRLKGESRSKANTILRKTQGVSYKMHREHSSSKKKDPDLDLYSNHQEKAKHKILTVLRSLSSPKKQPKWFKNLATAVSPYIEMFSWVNSFSINFLRREARLAFFSSLTFESVLAVINNLSPKKAGQKIMDESGPFFFEGNEVGILLTHGFAGNAQQMVGLGKFLNEEGGFTIFGVLLAGHGRSPATLAQTDMIDWYESIYEGYKLLKEVCSKVILVGHSMGGTLSLLLAVNEEVDGLVTLSTPVKVNYFMQDYLFLVADLLKYFPRRREEIQLMEEHNLTSYRVFSLRAVQNLLDLMEVAREEIKKVTAPILTITAGKDKRVPLDNAKRIRDLIKSKVKRDFFAPNSPHEVLFGPEKQIVAEQILRFINELIEGKI